MNTQACVRCRTSKRRCDKLDPICSRCRRAKLRCVYVYEEEGSSISSGTVGELVSPGESRVDRRSVKKRDRAVLSCTRCHQLKVKCDRGQPCGRCRRSGYGTNCTFSHDAPGSSSVRTLSTPSEEDPELVVATWFLRKSGSSQYKAILDRVSSIHFKGGLCADERSWNRCRGWTCRRSRTQCASTFLETAPATLLSREIFHSEACYRDISMTQIQYSH